MKHLLLAILLLGCMTAPAQTVIMPNGTTHPLGDMDGDGEVNISDVTALVNKILGKTSELEPEPVTMPDGSTRPLGDMDGDGEVNISDVTQLVNVILGKGGGLCPETQENSTLVLWHANGTQTRIELYKQPRVTFGDGTVDILSPVLNQSYPAADVLKFTYEGNGTGINDTKADQPYSSDGEHILFDAFYIYRNDGQFNAFFRDEVDSIHYSCYDLDSTFCNGYVTQVVYTSDSTYRIPLAAIDSVGFVTPETKYQPDVKVIEGDIRSYVLSSDSLTVFFQDRHSYESFAPHRRQTCHDRSQSYFSHRFCWTSGDRRKSR